MMFNIPPIYLNSTHYSKVHFKVHLVSKITLNTVTHIYSHHSSANTSFQQVATHLAFVLLLTYLHTGHCLAVWHMLCDTRRHVPNFSTQCDCILQRKKIYLIA